MIARFITLIFLILSFSGLTSCKKNPYRVNTSSIEVKIEIKRLEKDLFTMNPDEISSKVPYLKQKYKGFLQLFSYVINTGDIDDRSFAGFLVRFCTDKQNNDVYSLTIQKFPEIRDIEGDIQDAFRHYRYYFPDKQIPAIYTCITGFNNSIITGDSALGIGLDRYLGADSEYYKRLGIYNYLVARMTKENIVPDCIYGWGTSEWDFPALKYPADNVLAEMIHSGKIKYFEKCMLPDVSDGILFGFTTDQMKFCRKNESRMWQYLVEKDLLFKTDQMTIRKLTGEAPFTGYFTKDSPGRAAVWVGFRIIEAYMVKNPGIKMRELMEYTDIQDILEKAKYSPR
jgi:hypothetical protein